MDERARLESECTFDGYRGFESLPLRSTESRTCGSAFFIVCGPLFLGRADGGQIDRSCMQIGKHFVKGDALPGKHPTTNHGQRTTDKRT